QGFFIVAQAKDVLQVPMGALNQSARPPRAAGAGPAAGPGAGGPRASGEGGGAGAGDRRRPPEGRERREGADKRPRRATVKVLKADNTREERPVEIGVTNRIQAQVLSGLDEGEKVVAGTAASAA